MAFNPNAQGVFLLGQLILDYTNVDQTNNGDGRKGTPGFDNNGFSGDGPARTLNPDAEEFYPTAESVGPKVNGSGQFGVRVVNTPLTTHLQFPQANIQPNDYPPSAEIVELPYYAYTRPNDGEINNSGGPNTIVPPPANYPLRHQNWIPTTLLPPGMEQMSNCQPIYHPPYNENFMVRPGIILGPNPQVPDFNGRNDYTGTTSEDPSDSSSTTNYSTNSYNTHPETGYESPVHFNEEDNSEQKSPNTGVPTENTGEGDSRYYLMRGDSIPDDALSEQGQSSKSPDLCDDQS